MRNINATGSVGYNKKVLGVHFLRRTFDSEHWAVTRILDNKTLST